MTKLSVDQAFIKARSFIKNNEITEAKRLYQTILLAFPKNIRAQKELSTLNKYQQTNVNQGLLQEKIDHLINIYNQGHLAVVIEQAQPLTLQYPNAYMIWNLLGAGRKGLGQIEEASEAFKRVTELNPNYADGFNNLGVTLQILGKYDEAIEAYNKSLSIKPLYADGFINLGTALDEQGKLDEAIVAYTKALLIKPNFAEAHYKLGNILKIQGKYEEAIESYNKALSFKPNCPETYYNIGNVLRDLGKFDEAVETYKKSLSLNPKNPNVFINLGVALREQDKYEEAIEAYDKALSLKPDYAEAYHNKGLVFTINGKSDEAMKAYNKAILLKPDYADPNVYMSFLYLNNGKLKEGLDQYEWRWKTKKGLKRQRHFRQPLWDGKESLKDKRILIWSEQGIGDTINWSSLVSHVSSQAQHCILECQGKLVPLFERSFPNVEVKHANRTFDLERKDFDFHMPMGSIYKHCIEDISRNSNVKSHLIPDPVRVNFWKKRLQSLGDGPYIGISWKSSNMSAERILNYSSIEEWSPILKIPNVNFINLQNKDFEDDLIKIQDEFGVKVHNFNDIDHFDDIDDVAALCSALDMIISNKTTLPFISGGVGTSTKLANWRQSSWNNILLNPMSSSVKIYERNTWEPWENVFNSIAEDIFTITKIWSS